jgi:hypothetical protein
MLDVPSYYLLFILSFSNFTNYINYFFCLDFNIDARNIQR